jgi:hemerythrin superfamily protein
MDAITLLKSDHRTVEKLFKDFERAGDRAAVSKGKITQSIIKELSVHAAIEEQAFYPVIQREVQGATGSVLESLEEHHVAKWLLSELEGMDPRDERFDAKVKVLIESVRHHVEEEEGSLFPRVRAALGRKRLGEIGLQLEAAKKRVPVRPHPRSPDTPPGNLIAGAIGSVLDKVRTGAS